MADKITISIPEALQDKVEISSIYGNYTQKGNFSSYGVDLVFKELRQIRKLRSTNIGVLCCKVESTLEKWEKDYLNRTCEMQQKEQNEYAVDHLNSLKSILAHTLSVNDAVDWDSIKRNEPFRINPKDILEDSKGWPQYITFGYDGEPMSFSKMQVRPEPDLKAFSSRYGKIARLFRKEKIQNDYFEILRKWRDDYDLAEKENERRRQLLDDLQKAFVAKRKAFEKEKEIDNAAVDAVRERYQNAIPSAIEEYCDLVLSSSIYPDHIPRNWELEYRPENKMLVVQMDMPVPDDMPKVESYRLVKSVNTITPKMLSESRRREIYDSVLYQICLRTLHEIFESDLIDAIDTVVFNGNVNSVSPATGITESKIILSVSTSKTVFMGINLAEVDSKATFRHLKGVSAAALHGLTPIPPVVQLNKNDKRIVDSRVVYVDPSVNLAAMHWEDFEHLVRELFEMEFSAGGGEVKVTQASSDGGVDAIVFDPDPIRGGKIVIQAKRYTNVVGVSAVRDLYGTVMNEGAIKGVLVTTSDYGPDSYEFAKGKPLTLLNGSNLLSMLEKHGKRAYIDKAEAKKILGL